MNVYPKPEANEPTPDPSKAELTQPPDSKTTGKAPSKTAGKKK